jgi:hypothetical protein
MRLPIKFVLMTALFVASSTADAKKVAIILNGGHTEYENTEDAYEDIEKMDQKLKGWDRFILSADGPSRLPKNLRSLNSLKVKDGKTEFDGNGFPKLTRRDPKVEGNFIAAATRKNLERVLKEHVKSGDTVLLYFTDHGDRGQQAGESKIAFWKEMVSTPELREIIDGYIPKGARVILHNEQCFGGGILNSLRGANGRFRNNSCGFAIAAEHEFAEAKHSFAKSFEKKINLKPTDFGNLFDEHRRFNMTSSGVTLSDFFLQEYLQKFSNYNSLRTIDDSLSCRSSSASVESNRLHNVRISIQMPTLLHDNLQKITALTKSLCGYEILEGQDLNLASDVTPLLDAVTRKISILDGIKGLVEVQRLKPIYKEAFDTWIRREKNPMLSLKIKNLSARMTELNDLLSVPGKRKDKQVTQLQLNSVKAQFEKSMDQYNIYFKALKENSPNIVSKFAAFTDRTGTDNGNPYPKNIINLYQAAKTKMERGGSMLNSCKTLQNALFRFKALKLITDKKDLGSLEDFLDIQRCENTIL